MPNVTAAQPNIGGALCESSVIPFLVPLRKVWLTPAAGVPCSNAANIGEHKTWTQSGKIPPGGKSPQKCIYGVPAQETAKIVQSLVGLRWAICRCSNEAKTRNPLKFARVPETGVNRSQPLVGRSSPYCGTRGGEIVVYQLFSDCRCMPYLRRYSPTKLCDGAQMAYFWRCFASCIFSEPHAAHFRPAF